MMKKITFLLIVVSMLLSGCKQKTNNNESTLSNQEGNITSTVEP